MKIFFALILSVLLILSGCNNLPGLKIKNAKNQYEKGNYQTAFEQFGEVLAQGVDEPWLHYNMGNAAYKAGDFEQAQKSYSQALDSAPEAELLARAGYNIGNSYYRMAEQLETVDLEDALALYNDALLQYKSAIEQNPDDFDAKFNYELTERKIEELMEKLENEETSSGESSEEEQDEEEGEASETDSTDSGEQKAEDELNEEQDSSDQEEEGSQDQDAVPDIEEGAAPESGDTDADSGEEEQGMTLEEALMLLESMEDEEAERMNIYVPGNLPEVEKDW